MAYAGKEPPEDLPESQTPSCELVSDSRLYIYIMCIWTPRLPQLTDDPIFNPDCCVSLSTKFIEKVASLLRERPALTLSIGSGSGLFEALLLQHHPTLNLKAVEVSTKINKYLPDQSLHIVSGTWALDPSAKDAGTWVFTYPKNFDLVNRYAQAFEWGVTSRIIWIGPSTDLHDLEATSLAPEWEQIIVTDFNLCAYETMIIWRRHVDAAIC